MLRAKTYATRRCVEFASNLPRTRSKLGENCVDIKRRTMRDGPFSSFRHLVNKRPRSVSIHVDRDFYDILLSILWFGADVVFTYRIWPPGELFASRPYIKSVTVLICTAIVDRPKYHVRYRWWWRLRCYAWVSGETTQFHPCVYYNIETRSSRERGGNKLSERDPGDRRVSANGWRCCCIMKSGRRTNHSSSFLRHYFFYAFFGTESNADLCVREYFLPVLSDNFGKRRKT